MGASIDGPGISRHFQHVLDEHVVFAKFRYYYTGCVRERQCKGNVWIGDSHHSVYITLNNMRVLSPNGSVATTDLYYIKLMQCVQHGNIHPSTYAQTQECHRNRVLKHTAGFTNRLATCKAKACRPIIWAAHILDQQKLDWTLFSRTLFSRNLAI